MHKGDQTDPRVAVIEVVPDSVRYWLSTSNTLTKAADIVASAATGRTSAPGQLRTITKDEVCRNPLGRVYSKRAHVVLH